MKSIIIICGLILVQTVNAVEFKAYGEHDVPNPAKKITLDDAGNWLEITVNEWKDRVKTDDGLVNYLYKQGYNYQKQEGFVRIYSLDNKLISEKYSVDYDGMVAREEMLLAFELVKTHPVTSAILEQQAEVIELQGGFNFVDKNNDEACSKGKRCVHVFANTPTKSSILHAVVRLSDKTVPYPVIDTDTMKKRKK
ncbi:MAG: hypothetical protein ACSHWU_06405 [Marinicella sp.]